MIEEREGFGCCCRRYGGHSVTAQAEVRWLDSRVVIEVRCATFCLRTARCLFVSRGIWLWDFRTGRPGKPTSSWCALLCFGSAVVASKILYAPPNRLPVLRFPSTTLGTDALCVDGVRARVLESHALSFCGCRPQTVQDELLRCGLPTLNCAESAFGKFYTRGPETHPPFHFGLHS